MHNKPNKKLKCTELQMSVLTNETTNELSFKDGELFCNNFGLEGASSIDKAWENILPQ